jgi:hypothetical protein
MVNPMILALAASAVAGTTTKAVTPPIACRANALDKTQRQRQQALLDTVRRTVRGKHDLPDGVTLSFPAEPTLFLQLAEWISLERRCCPFMEFTLEWKSNDCVSVRLTGQPGVKDVITAEMGIAADR